MKQAMSEAEVQEVLRSRPDWSFKGGKLIREWTFKDFVEAMLFVNRIAVLAEDADHHPDIDVRYNHVVLGLVSHDAGGITQRDVAMAARISDEFPLL